MKKSKRTNASIRDNGIDRISNLSDALLHLILSRLPTTEEVIRTSILSTRWRYLWTSIPSLDIDCTRVLKPSTNFKKHKFEEFVYWVLINKTLDLESFRLCCSNFYNMSTVGRWIHVAVMRKVKSLDLLFCPRNENEVIDLPHCLIICESLDTLRLHLCRKPMSLPNLTCFPALRVLELNSVELRDDDSVRQFLISCPLLEDLSLIDCLLHKLNVLCISSLSLKTLRIDNQKMKYFVECDCYDDYGDKKYYHYDGEGLCNTLQIYCPKLVSLEYAGHIAYGFSIENVESLKKAKIYCDDMSQSDLSFESFGATMRELFVRVSHVESLSINPYFIQSLDASHYLGDFPTCFPNLKTLEISITAAYFSMDIVTRILKCCASLESLCLTIQEEYDWPESWELDEVLALNLKRVEFVDFNGEKPKLELVRLLLGRGNELEEIVFTWKDEIKCYEKSMIMKEVFKFHKANSSVKLVTL